VTYAQTLVTSTKTNGKLCYEKGSISLILFTYLYKCRHRIFCNITCEGLPSNYYSFPFIGRAVSFQY